MNGGETLGHFEAERRLVGGRVQAPAADLALRDTGALQPHHGRADLLVRRPTSSELMMWGWFAGVGPESVGGTAGLMDLILVEW